MTVTREIATTDWDEFLHVFSERNQGRRVRLETSVRPGEGTPVLAEHQPLMGVDLDSKGSAAPAITVTLGGMDTSMPLLSHVIHAPRHLWAEEDADGLALALDIDSTSEGKTLLLFENAEALPAAKEA